MVVGNSDVVTAAVASQPAGDRRARRHRETLEEILETSLAVMAETGAAGLSLGEVARRMGIRPPSLYQYVRSKNDVYDALFRRGWEQVNAHVVAQVPDPGAAPDARSVLTETAVAFVRWMVEHPVQAQLMVWRPVPGFVPSAEAFEPAQRSLALLRSALSDLADRGLLHPDARGEQAVRLHTSLVAGALSQHLSNEPGTPYDEGSFTALVPLLIDLFVDRYPPRRRSTR